MGLRETQSLELAHIPRLLRERDPAPNSSSSSSSSALSHRRASAGDADSSAVVTSEDPVAELTMTASLEAQWAKRKAQFYSHFKSMSDSDKTVSADGEQTSENPVADDLAASAAAHHADSKCHVCNVALRLLRLRHHCRNCGLSVCGVHSKNQVPLPHLGIMKEVRVCDICTRQLVQRRAGYRSPKKRRSSSQRRSTDENDELSPLMVDKLPDTPVNGCASPPSSGVGFSSLVDSQLFGHMDGILYSCTLEEQDNTVDDILYLGTFTMGGRSFVSRRMSANVAIWKDRTFMLTSAEMLCFKATEDTAALGEVRSSVHLTEILHVEVNDQFPRIMTVIRSDGRIFRIRAKTPEQCQEIAVALKKAMRLFQDAMYKLQRGPQPEDNCISCVTIQHESSLPEQVVVAAPEIGEVFHVDMYPSSILRLYVNGPNANGVALYSCEMLSNRTSRNHVVEADPLPSAPGAEVLHVTLHAEDVPPNASSKESRRNFWALIAFLVALASAMKTARVTSVELLAWLMALVLVLTRFHNPISLLITTKRLHFYRKFSVNCVQIVMGKSDESTEGSSEELIPDDELDSRFLEGCNGEVDEAKRRYVKTMQWRKENDIDNIFMRPAPHFAAMKESFPHYTHKKDKLGHPLSIEYLGSMKKSMEHFLSRGVTEADAVIHNILMQEFLWKVIDPRPFPEGVMLKIYDIKGISMSDVSGDVFNYMKQLGEIVAEYNPERIYQVFIINPPSWFNFIWKLVSPLINPKTRERVHVLRGQKDIQKALLEFIDPENLPVEYGGTCRCEGGCATHSPEETDLREYIEFVNSNTGAPGDAVIREKFDRMCAKYHAQLPKDGFGAMNGATSALSPTQTEM